MRLRIISRSEILSLITMHDAIEAMARAFGQLSAGAAEMPVRGALTAGKGISLFMPARLGATGERGAKIVSVYGGNRSRGLPSINGVILMLDDETGLPAALMDAGELTAIRTAAAAGLAARLLSRAECRVLAIFGAGAQAPRQIEAVRAMRPIQEVRVVSKGGESAARLAGSLDGVEAHAMQDSAEAVDGADIIVAVTTSRTPVFDGSGLPAGTHVSGSGSFLPDRQEIGSEVVTRARVVVEERGGRAGGGGRPHHPDWAGAGDAGRDRRRPRRDRQRGPRRRAARVAISPSSSRWARRSRTWRSGPRCCAGRRRRGWGRWWRFDGSAVHQTSCEHYIYVVCALYFGH